MKHGIAARHRLLERRGITQIAYSRFGVQPLQIFQIARWTDQQPKIRALIRKDACYVRAEESGGACDKNLQSRVSVLAAIARIAADLDRDKAHLLA